MKLIRDAFFGCEGRSQLFQRLRVQHETSHNRLCSGATVASEARREFNVRERPFRPPRLDAWVTQALRPALCAAGLSARRMPLDYS